jgi:hypothetical protein
MTQGKGIKMRMMAKKQAGMGLVGFIMVAVGIVLVAVLGMKIVPPYIHSAQIAQIFKAIANDPAMQTASVKDIQEAYSKRANINYITDITANDIDIAKDERSLSISASYSVKIPLVANITLLLEFNPSSS